MEWEQLRDKFFKECTTQGHRNEIAPTVNIAPHDLFEWFKKELSESSKEDNQDELWKEVIDIVDIESARSEGYSYVINRIKEKKYSITKNR